MQIVITYGDGSVEKVPVTLKGVLVSSCGSWVPGHSVAQPTRCSVGSDFFCAAIDEGGLTSGSMEASDEDDLQEDAFSWVIDGSDENECILKLRYWIGVLGSHFDCSLDGESYLLEGIMRILDADEAQAYDRDRECWEYFLDDPEYHSRSLLSEAGLNQSAPQRP